MDHLDVIDRETRRFAEVLAGTDPAARVPTCPDWDAGDLLWHLAGVHRFWATVLADDPTDEEAEALDLVPPGDRPAAAPDMLTVLQAATVDLLAQLRRLADDEPRWSWWEADRTVGFTRRMQTYEATLHRVDAELTAGVPPSPIPADVAAGAVTHCVDVMWGWMPPWAAYEPQVVVDLAATDTADRWRVEIGRWTGVGPESGRSFDEPRAVRATAGEPSGTVRASAEQLARWAWGRSPAEAAVRIDGDAAATAALDRLLAMGIQ